MSKRFSLPWVYVAIPLLIFAGNVYVQSYNNGRFLNIVADEGVYLYAAKLLALGQIPYKDFFLAHPPFAVGVLAVLLQAVNFDINAFRIAYIVWIFSSIFPLFFLIRTVTKSTVAATLGLLLFSTYQGLVALYAREFSLRAFSLPLLAFALYYFYNKKNLLISAIFLSLFAMVTVPNLLLATVLVGLLVVQEFFKKKTLKIVVQEYKLLLLIFGVLVFAYYAIIFLIPNAYANIVQFQLGRKSFPFHDRTELLHLQMVLDWPLYALGFLGAILMLRKYLALGLFVFLSLLLTVYTGNSFYDHYLIILAVPLTLAASFFIAYFCKKPVIGIVVSIALIFCLYKVAYENLHRELIEKTSLHDFEAISLLKQTPETVFVVEPILALYANKTITPSYYAADMRAFGTLKKQLMDPEYVGMLTNSNTVVVGPFENRIITDEVKLDVVRNFHLVYESPWYKVYVR